jgi:hypothetical protein
LPTTSAIGLRLHLLQFAETAVPALAAIFLEINALILIMIVALVLHEATAMWNSSSPCSDSETTRPMSACG